MVFYVKRSYVYTNLKITLLLMVVEPIMFLSRLLTLSKKHYWVTKLEVLYIV
jgi:hypothetical protein